MEKDVRNFLYPDNRLIITFHDYDAELGDLYDFNETMENIASFYKYITVSDVLAFLNEDNNFQAAYDYGWKIHTFFKYVNEGIYNQIANTYTINLPKPTKIIKSRIY